MVDSKSAGQNPTTARDCGCGLGERCPVDGPWHLNPTIAPLQDAAEQVILAYGMGWDMDGVIEQLRDALPEDSPCGNKAHG